MRTIWTFLLLVTTLATVVPAAETVTVSDWLMAGPVPRPLPAFAEENPGKFAMGRLLEAPALPEVMGLRPGAGEAIESLGLRWSATRARKDGTVRLDPPRGGKDHPAAAWLAVHVSVDRWTRVELKLEGQHPRRAWLDGRPVASGGKAAEEDVSAPVDLERGEHLLLVKTTYDPAREAPWSVGATWSGESEDATIELGLSLSRERSLTIRDVLDPPRITSLDLSPDGRQVVTSVTRIVPGTDQAESWVEIRDTEEGRLVESWRGAIGARAVAFSPDGRYVSYLAASPGDDDGKPADLFLLDRRERRAWPLLSGVERLGDYVWSPTAKHIVFRTTVEAEKDERGVKLLEGLLDRWAGFRDKQQLHLVAVPEGTRTRLTAGALSATTTDFSPAGDRILFTRRAEALRQRPYTRTELWEMDLETLEHRKLRDFRWINDARYAPDGRRLLIAAPADAFGDAGVNLGPGRIGNSYEGQLFIWDPASDRVEPITRDFDPAVTAARWSPGDGKIYLVAQDRDYSRFYRHDPDAPGFQALRTGFDMFGDPSIARSAPIAVGLGSSPWQPQALVAVDLAAGTARRLTHAADGWFDDVHTGQVESWSFESAAGKRIDGRVYFPPGFDSSRRYPALVYYYGGTSPIGREFGGRYPKELWAAHGYVVYVLQPSGATGFGQEFAADHVNDWGRTTAEEIIEGTRKFLAAHPFVDPDRVGCLGASYGGFMTMLLTTKTDLYAAAVAHAGISSLASYWGEGYWGFLYSAVATADSFPWNRRDLYVDQSPLFRADQTRVPLLLTHGVDDTNVPVGESDAFYIALKLLGKDVEYLQVEGQDHWIVDHGKRIVWNDTILAWFARHLKDRPEWWQALHPDRAAEEK